MADHPWEEPPPPPGAAPAWGSPPPVTGSRRLARSPWFWAALAAVVVGVVAVAVIVNRRGTPAPASASSPSGGASFAEPTGHFSAVFGSTPVEDDNTLNVRGQSLHYIVWTNVVDTDTAEAVGYVTYPDTFVFNAPNAALDGAVAGEASNVGGTTVSKTFGMYEGFHSVDAVIAVARGFEATRVVLAGRTVFIVVATSTHNPPERFASLAASLRILSHAP